MEMTLAIIAIGVVAFIIALVFGTFVSKRMDKAVKEINSYSSRSFVDALAIYDTADMLACTHVKCKRRKTPDEYQNIRLLEIGYEQYCNQRSVPEGGVAGATPPIICPECDARKFYENINDKLNP